MKKLLLLLLLLHSVLAQAEWFNGENLLQPTPIPGKDWETRQQRNNDFYQHTWHRDDGKDVLQTNIFYHTPYRDVFTEKNLDSDIGKKNCRDFIIEDEKAGSENGYPTLNWRSKCTMDDQSVITVLHKAISGNSSFYHLKRVWLKDYDDDEMDLWQTYFSAVSICDTRYQEHACPR